MECRETQTLLTAFHDGELPAADRARVEEHLRGCLECGALLTGLTRADLSAGVPDPGPGYWDRFNARVMDRIDREADGPGAAILRPKHGWMRQQLRYLVPAAAAAALVVVVVRYGGMHPGAPAPAVPPAVSERAAPDAPGERTGEAFPESRAAKKTESPAVARRVPPPAIAKERFATLTREERDRPADRSLPAGNDKASRDRAAAPAAIRVPSPPGTAEDAIPSEMKAGRKKMAGEGPLMEDRQVAGKAESASGMRIAKEQSTVSPCERALALAERERIRDAEASQRACLGGDLDAPSREKGLVFLAELLDRQARFSEADEVIAEVDRRFPRSRPLDLYRQQRPMVQQLPKAVPVTR